MTAASLGGRLADDRGSVIVFVAVTLMLLVLFAVFVVDVGNWWVHKRHLQTQADAAALAGANALHYPCDWSAAQAEGSLYGGAPYNPQVGGSNQGHLTVLFNSATYAPGEPPAADPTAVGDACETGIVDAKATEANLPLFFSGVVPGFDVTINAHARAHVAPVAAMKEFLPLAVEDADVRHVFARFTHADGSSAVVWLTRQEGTATWTSPVSLPVDGSISVDVGLVYSKTASADCGAFPAVQCFDQVEYVRGWTAAAPPALDDVRILPGSCAPDGYFATAACALGLSAVLDLGARALSGPGVTTSVWATIAGDSHKYALSPGGAGPGPVTWSTAAGIPLTAAPQASAITVHWNWKQTQGSWQGSACTNSKPCTATGSQLAQRAYLADDSVPLTAVELRSQPDLVAGANSFQTGGTQELLVEVDVRSSLAAAAAAGEPTVMLRTASGSSSNSQAVDCDAGVNFADEVNLGCQTPYQVNPEAVCPNGDSPASCIPTQTGDFVGQLRQGLNTRFAACPTNNWNASSPGNIQLDDPRLVPLLIVPTASFSGSGTHLLPVLKFAFFYVTGWDGGACAGNEPYPGSGAPHGDVWGHFFKYTGAVPGAQPGEGDCDLQSGDPGACVVELIR